MSIRKPLIYVGGEIMEISGDDGISPGGPAGGVLDGTYPNPDFAVPMATKEELGDHVDDTANPHSTTKAQVGLGAVDNTSDANKPVSTATQTALNLKAPLANPTFTGTVTGVTKTHVGLGNVDNTSDVNKPVSTAQAAADLAALNTAKAYADGLVIGLLDDRGNHSAAANTWPTTGGSGSAGAILKGDLWTISVAGTLGGTVVGVGDVIRAKADTPGTTAANWVITENNLGYVPENSASKDTSGGYVGLSGWSVKLRNAANTFTNLLVNASTAVRTWTMPDKDGTVAMTSDITKSAVGLSNVDNTSDVNKPISTAQQAALDLKAALLTPESTQSLHVGAIVKAIIYDTSKDSDGGAWRKRCADKSWYTETLGGDRWIGQQATIAAAWTAAGSATGAVFQASATAGPLTSGKYYAATGATTATEVFRGISREFPAVAGIVAESIRVVIYDLTQPGCPMWMVFTGNNWGGSGTFFGTAYAGTSATSLCMLNGILLIGVNNGTPFVGGLSYVMFVKDSFGKIGYSTGSGGSGTGVANRRFFAGYRLDRASLDFPVAIVDATVNDVAITILDNAPIDAATGLPVPTIAVGTAGGTSIIQSDGTVTSVANAGGWFTKRLAFNKLGTLFGHGGTAAYGGLQPISYPPYTSIAAIGTTPNVGYPQIGAVATGYGVTAANPYLLGGNNDSSIVIGGAVPSAKGLTLLRENPATPAKGMVTYVTKDYNSGWLPGDIRGAYLADTTAETVTASTLISSTFTGTGALDGWTLSATAVNNSGVNQLDITTGGASDRLVEFVSSTVSGKTYTLTLDTVTYPSVYVYQVDTPTPIGITGAAGTYSFNFVAAGNNVLIILAGSGAAQRKIVDNISVKLAEPDRSVKNKGLVVNGSLTKTAVASGAGLVAWSGFSAANYLEQPYNSDLDFGTGDFCVMGWYRVSSLSHDCTLFYRGAGVPSYAPAAGFNIWAQGGAVKTQIGGVTLESNYSLRAAAWILISVMRVSGVVYIHADGVLIGSGSNTSNLSGAQISRIGAGYWSGADHSLALWRISATAPSADQIAHIYRTELPLFQAGAQCTIAGTSTAVTALDYDDTTELLHVGTSWGRSGFKDLLRVDSETTTTGGTTSLSANQGAILTGGSSGKYYQPALLLRDELRRKDEARKAMGRVQVALDFTATAAQTAFVCTKGYDVRSVYANGLLKRVGTDYTVSDDGFKKTVTFTAGQLVGVPVTAMLTRA